MKKSIHIIVFFITSVCFSQEYKKELVFWYDKNIGSYNTLISWGEKYSNKDLFFKDTHPFFKENKFVTGDITYCNEFFFDVKLKYDVNNQEIVVYLNDEYIGSRILRLFISNVQELSIYGSKFKQVNFCYKKDCLNGIYEELHLSKKIHLLVKHSKSEVDEPFKGLVHKNYKEVKKKFYVKYLEGYHRVSSKKDFEKIFSNNQNDIKKFYKQNKAKYISKREFFLNLIRYMETKMKN